MTKLLTKTILAVALISVANPVLAGAAKRQTSESNTVLVQNSVQQSPRNGGTSSWPQTIDELENAYNCGPYADRESAKKCKE